MQFIYYPKCSTCQKAKKFLDAHGLDYEARDIVQEVPSAEELRSIIEKSGLPSRRFFNTSGQRYRALGLKDKLDEMAEEERYVLLASDGMLIKRPILVYDDGVLVGFKEAAWQEALLR